MTHEEIVLTAIDTVVGCNGKPEYFAESNQTVFRVGLEVVKMLKKEIARRGSFVKDSLIGQSPEDLARHYKLIGQQEAFNGLLKYLEGNDIQS